MTIALVFSRNAFRQAVRQKRHLVEPRPAANPRLSRELSVVFRLETPDRRSCGHAQLQSDEYESRALQTCGYIGLRPLKQYLNPALQVRSYLPGALRRSVLGNGGSEKLPICESRPADPRQDLPLINEPLLHFAFEPLTHEQVARCAAAIKEWESRLYCFGTQGCCAFALDVLGKTFAFGIRQLEPGQMWTPGSAALELATRAQASGLPFVMSRYAKEHIEWARGPADRPHPLEPLISAAARAMRDNDDRQARPSALPGA